MGSEGIVMKSLTVASATYLSYVIGKTAWTKKVNGSTSDQANRVGLYAAAGGALLSAVGVGAVSAIVKSLRGR